MCVAIHMKDGKDIETVKDFEEHFDVDADNYIDPSYQDYQQLNRDACLCQVDLDEFFIKNPKIEERFEYDGDFWEK